MSETGLPISRIVKLAQSAVCSDGHPVAANTWPIEGDQLKQNGLTPEAEIGLKRKIPFTDSTGNIPMIMTVEALDESVGGIVPEIPVVVIDFGFNGSLYGLRNFGVVTRIGGKEDVTNFGELEFVNPVPSSYSYAELHPHVQSLIATLMPNIRQPSLQLNSNKLAEIVDGASHGRDLLPVDAPEELDDLAASIERIIGLGSL